MLLRNRSGEGFVGCYQRSQSTLRMRAGYEKDVLTAFAGLRLPVRLETRSSRDVHANLLRCFCTPRSHRNQRELRGGSSSNSAFSNSASNSAFSNSAFSNSAFSNLVALLKSVALTIEGQQNCVEIKKRRSHNPPICPHPCDESIQLRHWRPKRERFAFAEILKLTSENGRIQTCS